MKNLLLVLLILQTATAVSTAQSKIPDTPAARQFSAWLDAFNTGDRATLARFIELNYPSGAVDLDRQLNLRRRTGGFDFKQVGESSANHFVAITKERGSDQYGRCIIEVEATEPHRITRLELRAIPPPGASSQPRMSEADALAALRTDLDQQTAKDNFSGAIAITKNGRTIFASANGMADRDSKIPNQLDTRFRIGSMNKMFTATAVLQLVQAGKIKLHDPLGKYLPNYPNSEVASKVTIHQLLTHTGGTGDIFGPDYFSHRLELRTLQDYVNLYGKRGLAFEPGSRWEYSNYGFLLLGLVIENVSAQDYYDYVRDHIFKPAGMNSTGSLPEDQAVANRAIGYTKLGGELRTNSDTLPYRGTSAGGGYSTVNDLLRFADLLTTNKLLDAQHTDSLVTGKVDTPDGGKYAYGFRDQTINGVRCFGHGGGAPGMNGELMICPESGYVIAVLANMDPPASERIAEFIRDRLPAK